VVKVRINSWPNDKKSIIWQFKTGDFIKLCQITSKINTFATRVVFRHFMSFLNKNEILWSLDMDVIVFVSDFTLYDVTWANNR